MKAFLNPLLLIVCILLLAFGYASVSSGEVGGWMVETWVLTLCLLGVVINGTLGVARALTGRPSVQSIGWAVGFLVAGSVVWTLVSGEGMESLSSQERALLEQRVEAWKSGQGGPWQVDENGDCVLTLAAGLDENGILQEILEDADASRAHAEVMLRAAQRATERNREQSLRLLVAAGVPVDATCEGMPLLHWAAFAKARRAAACLLELGADVHSASADGSTALHHAVLADDAEMVRLLMQHGADPARLNADGRDAASYARSEAVSVQLAPSSPAAP